MSDFQEMKVLLRVYPAVFYFCAKKVQRDLRKKRWPIAVLRILKEGFVCFLGNMLLKSF